MIVAISWKLEGFENSRMQQHNENEGFMPERVNTRSTIKQRWRTHTVKETHIYSLKSECHESTRDNNGI